MEAEVLALISSFSFLDYGYGSPVLSFLARICLVICVILVVLYGLKEFRYIHSFGYQSFQLSNV